jgi:hypothetical protein
MMTALIRLARVAEIRGDVDAIRALARSNGTRLELRGIVAMVGPSAVRSQGESH